MTPVKPTDSPPGSFYLRVAVGAIVRFTKIKPNQPWMFFTASASLLPAFSGLIALVSENFTF